MVLVFTCETSSKIKVVVICLSFSSTDLLEMSGVKGKVFVIFANT